MTFSIFSKILSRTTKTLKPNVTIFSRTYQNGTNPACEIDPFAEFMPLLRDPNARVSPVLDQWVKEGGNANSFSISTIIKNLRARKRCNQALEVSGVFTRTYQNGVNPAYGIDPFEKSMPLLRDRNARVSPVLDQWVKEGGNANSFSLSTIVKNLRARKRYNQALEVYEWISSCRPGKLSHSDLAIQLDLISRVHGLEAAERFFKSMDSEDKVLKTYGALLFCYSFNGDVEKSLSTMQKMKELGFPSTTFTYSCILSAYAKSGQIEKVPDVLSEMKENGVMPNVFSYNICIASYGERGDIDSVDTIIKEAESQPETVNCHTYATLGSIYMKAGQEQKAMGCLRKCEAMDKDGQFYGGMISQYASLGKKDEMMRLWGVLKEKLKIIPNMECVNMINCLVKLEEYEESEKLLKEWEVSCHFYDFRVPNALILGYSKKGLVEKAEAVLRGMIERRTNVSPGCWTIIAEGYERKQNMEKAYECMKSALALQNKRWKPKPSKFYGVLSWLGDNGNVEDVEEFVRSLEVNVPKNRDMFHALLKAYIRGGKSVNELVDKMKDANIDEDEETERILSSIDSHFRRPKESSCHSSRVRIRTSCNFIKGAMHGSLERKSELPSKA